MDNSYRTQIKIGAVVLLLIWLVIILSLTVLGREPFDGRHFQPQLFWSYSPEQLAKPTFVRQVIGNIVAYIPLGFLLPILLREKLGFRKCFVLTLAIGIAISFCTESIQYLFRIGLFEFDDMIHNGLGAVIGFLLYRVMVCIGEAVGKRIEK